MFLLSPQDPVYLKSGSTITVHIWHLCNEKKVWYEYRILWPQKSTILAADLTGLVCNDFSGVQFSFTSHVKKFIQFQSILHFC